MFILDFGSGNTCQNDYGIIERMIDELDDCNLSFKEDIIIKWQLFESAGDNTPLWWSSFNHAYLYALEKGYATTASVFDRESVEDLLKFEIPFIKIANRKDLWPLTRLVPRGIPLLISITETGGMLPPVDWNGLTKMMCCISEYPASLKQYEEIFMSDLLSYAVSDHTMDWKLYLKYRPQYYECHYKLEDSTGLDAGKFARTPADLKELDMLLEKEVEILEIK